MANILDKYFALEKKHKQLVKNYNHIVKIEPIILMGLHFDDVFVTEPEEESLKNFENRMKDNTPSDFFEHPPYVLNVDMVYADALITIEGTRIPLVKQGEHFVPAIRRNYMYDPVVGLGLFIGPAEAYHAIEDKLKELWPKAKKSVPEE